MKQYKSSNTKTTVSHKKGSKKRNKFKAISVENWPVKVYKNGRMVIPTVIENVKFMLRLNDINIRFNKLTKKLEIQHDKGEYCSELKGSADWALIISLASLNGLNVNYVERIIPAIAAENFVCPVSDWIESAEWDQQDHISDLIDTIETNRNFPIELKKILITKWLISAVAAVKSNGEFSSRGILTLQGPQSIGKTRWIANLVGDQELSNSFIKLDHHMDGYNKDSILSAIRHWICELGELDSSFKSGISRIKGYITANIDKVRQPYDRVESEFPRRTVFCATVNDSNYLIDDQNTRFWTLPCLSIKYNHDINTVQLWSQVLELYKQGEEWWLTKEEEQLLESQNLQHRSVSVIRDLIGERLDFNAPKEKYIKETASGVLRLIDFEPVNNKTARECGSILRNYFGPNTGSTHGSATWMVPPLKNMSLDKLKDDSTALSLDGLSKNNGYISEP